MVQPEKAQGLFAAVQAWGYLEGFHDFHSVLDWMVVVVVVMVSQI